MRFIARDVDYPDVPEYIFDAPNRESVGIAIDRHPRTDLYLELHNYFGSARIEVVEGSNPVLVGTWRLGEE